MIGRRWRNMRRRISITAIAGGTEAGIYARSTGGTITIEDIGSVTSEGDWAIDADTRLSEIRQDVNGDDYTYYSGFKDQKVVNPQGPDAPYDPYQPYLKQKVMRGGSFLCNEAYCSGYRVAARMKSTPDTGLHHTGFRLVKSAN